VSGQTGASAPPYGPKNALLLRHELAVSDLYVWLALAAQAGRDAGHELLEWRSGRGAAIRLGTGRGSRRFVRPDAWFAYRLAAPSPAGAPPAPVLVGLAEIDRGTERFLPRWAEKAAAYSALFARGYLKAATGYANARVIVVTPDAGRRDALAGYLSGLEPSLANRFWLAERGALLTGGLSVPAWRTPGSALLRPLIPAEWPLRGP
jgi:hypothetical protein